MLRGLMMRGGGGGGWGGEGWLAVIENDGPWGLVALVHKGDALRNIQVCSFMMCYWHLHNLLLHLDFHNLWEVCARMWLHACSCMARVQNMADMALRSGQGPSQNLQSADGHCSFKTA